jgi:hypothetical protein
LCCQQDQLKTKYDQQDDDMSLWSKTLGGLRPGYYFRQLFFGSLFGGAFALFLSQVSGPPAIVLYVVLGLNTALYPYARFAMHTVVGFIQGGSVIVLPLLMSLVLTYLLMGVCFAAAIFLAPMGLIMLYVQNSQSSNPV